MTRIHLCLAHMSGNERKFIDHAFDSNWIAPAGSNIDGFEEDIRQFIESDENGHIMAWAEGGHKAVVALNTGTAALHLALIGCGVSKGDIVIVQTFTFCASANPIVYLGASPVFVDSEPDTWNMDPDLLEKAIEDTIMHSGKKPKAIVAVHLYGMPAKLDKIKTIADMYDIPIIEDAAEAFGSRYKGQACGTFGKYGILSFNGNKIITTSGGGAIICPDDGHKKEMIYYATQAKEEYPYYQHKNIGYNYRMSNISAGVGRGQMTALTKHIHHHRNLASIYEEAFMHVEGIKFHKVPSEEYYSNYWLSTVTIDPTLQIAGQDKTFSNLGIAAPNANVEALRIYLDRKGIETRPLWKPLHLQPAYSGAMRYTVGVSESLFKKGLCLPSGPWVGEKEASYVVDSIKGAIHHS